MYLQNPAIYAALFGPLSNTDSNFGHLAETAVLCHWMQLDKTAKRTYYARWKTGELDLVSIHHGKSEPQAAIEIKWSDLAFNDSREISGPLEFCENRKLSKLWGKSIVNLLTKNDDWSFPD